MAWGNVITKDVAGRNAVYAMMASNSYHDASKPVFNVGLLGWKLVDKEGKESTGPSITKINNFACDIYENELSNKTVIAYRGSDSKFDWLAANLAAPISIPYKSAKKVARQYMEKKPERELTVVGHSLGGGLALSVSVHYGVRALTFNTSPRIFDGWGDNHQPGVRVIIYQKGDPLSKVREGLFEKKLLSAVKVQDIHMTVHTVEAGKEHDSDLMAIGLAEAGKQAIPELGEIIREIRILA